MVHEMFLLILGQLAPANIVNVASVSKDLYNVVHGLVWGPNRHLCLIRQLAMKYPFTCGWAGVKMVEKKVDEGYEAPQDVYGKKLIASALGATCPS